LINGTEKFDGTKSLEQTRRPIFGTTIMFEQIMLLFWYYDGSQKLHFMVVENYKGMPFPIIC